ncbi:IS66 family transposase [Psychromonas ossibalaenae]|uniref:IS66 family transposase n=4 Tax=Psychromonas ossibalaenae TaxID=444922 RepID=UPI000683D831|nr:IS66 family transposase [Psychromonas ossibalaenae]
MQEKDKIILDQTAQINELIEKFQLAQHKQFGQSSESHAPQDIIFNEAELIIETADCDIDGECENKNDSASQSVTLKNKPKRQKLPENLPRDVIIHDIDEAQKHCACCGSTLHKMGEERTEKLEFIPAKIKVIEHVRLKYSCRECERSNTQTRIKIAPVPSSPIAKGMATSSLLSQVIISKYQYALPLYRQESMFQQVGISLSRQTLSDWIIKSSLLLKPLVERLQEVLLKQPVIHADETPLKVIKEERVNCYMWVYCSGTDSPSAGALPNIVLYDYQNSRAGACPVAYLGGYKGYLQVDGYAGYSKTDAILVGCMAHARRKFKEVVQAQPKGKTGKANWALNQIQKLYRIEAVLKGKSPAEKRTVRREHSQPLLDKFKEWLDKSAEQVPPKSALGKAVSYSINQWPKLVQYINDGQLSIDNNRAERAIKPFVIGRKNWLFANTKNGAVASAILYSVIETAKANGLMPFNYLMHCLEQLSNQPDEIDSLLPWNVKLEPV